MVIQKKKNLIIVEIKKKIGSNEIFFFFNLYIKKLYYLQYSQFKLLLIYFKENI